jgi:hypothetical protein
MSTESASGQLLDRSPASSALAVPLHVAGRYRLGSQFVLRMTGFPVEILRSLRSSGLAAAVDALLAASDSATTAAAALVSALPPRAPKSLRRRIKARRWLDATGLLHDETVEAYHRSLTIKANAEADVQSVFERELQVTRRGLYALVADDAFREVLLLSSPSLESTTSEAGEIPPVRNSGVYRRELRWVSYIQRLAAKNETISFFGPSVWGTVDASEPAAAAIDLAWPPIAARTVYIERWVCEALARHMADDPDAAPLLCPTPADDLLLDGNRAVFLGTNLVLVVTDDEREAIRRSDGTRRAFEVGSASLVDDLVRRGVLVRGLRLPFTGTPFEELRREVMSWPDGPARTRWTAQLDRIDQTRADIERAPAFQSRRDRLKELATTLTDCGVEASRAVRTLYAARLPVNEECQRAASRVVLGGPVLEQATRDLAPWYDLWRDLAGIFATRMRDALGAVWTSLGGRPVPLARFLAACESAGLPLNDTGGTTLCPEIEVDVQRAWQDQLGDRASAREITLTADDLTFLRRRFTFRRMKAFDNPAPDLQIVARRADDLGNQQWTLLVGELHPDFSPWQHALFVWCPDRRAFATEYRRSGYGPAVVYGSHPPHCALAHCALHIHQETDDWTFVGTTPPAGLPFIRSGDALVDVTDDDVVVRHPEGRLLGSLVHTWNAAASTHQIELLGTGPHVPRLRVGRVIVQRESWLIQPDDALRRATEAGGQEAFVALRRLRAAGGLPEEVFVRACLPNRFSQHKQSKPLFVDFRSPLLTELLARTIISRFRRLRLTEMLPSTDDFWLKDQAGHYGCEFRLVAFADPDTPAPDSSPR